MQITFDPAKNERNLRERGLPFEWAAQFDFEGALYSVDDRRNYGETRHVAIGLLHDRLHVLCFTETADGIRIISFRKANEREVRRHARSHTAD